MVSFPSGILIFLPSTYNVHENKKHICLNTFNTNFSQTTVEREHNN